MMNTHPLRTALLRCPTLTTLAGLLLAASAQAQTPISQKLPLPTEVMSGSILFASLVGPPDGYAVRMSVHAEFVAGGSFTPDDLQIVLSAPTKPNFPHWVLQGGPDFGWGTSSGLHVGDASTVILNGEIQPGLPGISVWSLQIEPVPGSGHSGVTGNFTSGAYFQVDYLPAGAGPAVGYCFGSSCPCGNDDPGAGCVNSTGAGALLSATGLASVAGDDLTLVQSGMPGGNVGIFFAGESQTLVPFGAGLNCVSAGSLGLIRLPAGVANASGTLTSAAVISTAQGIVPASLAPGSTWNFQGWYRDPVGPCGSTVNLSNALQVVLIP